MRARLERLMSAYGQDVALTRRETGETLRLRAFLQPVLKRREDLPAAATPLGAVSRQRWLYIGSGGQEITPGDRVSWSGPILAAQESRPVWWRGEVLYYWAILRPEREGAQ